MVRKRLHNLELVQKTGNRLPHELSERKLKKQKTICELLILRELVILASNCD